MSDRCGHGTVIDAVECTDCVIQECEALKVEVETLTSALEVLADDRHMGFYDGSDEKCEYSPSGRPTHTTRSVVVVSAEDFTSWLQIARAATKGGDSSDE